MNTNEKGNRGLANVILDVTNKGYFSFLPFTDTTNVDLIIGDEDMKLYRIQVKYSKVDKTGVIKVSTSNVVDRKRVPVKFDHIDLWGIYCPDTNEVYYVSKSELVKIKSAMCLRVSSPKQKSPFTHYAKDYLDIKKALK